MHEEFYLTEKLEEKWQRLDMSVVPTSAVASMTLTLLMENVRGEVCFQDVSVSAPSGNLLLNPSMDGIIEGEWYYEKRTDSMLFDDTSYAKYWEGLGKGGYTPSEETAPEQSDEGFGHSVGLPHNKPNGDEQQADWFDMSGATQTLILDQAEPAEGEDYEEISFYFGGWARAQNIDTIADRASAAGIWLEIFYQDETMVSYFIEASRRNKYNDVWKYYDQVVVADRPVERARLTAGITNMVGRIEFDGMSLIPFTSGESSPALAPLRGVFGDPHLISIDGAAFDFHRVGEFELVSTSKVVSQARYRAMGDGTVTSALAVASRATGSRVFIDAQAGVFINSRSVDFGVVESIDEGEWVVSMSGELCDEAEPLTYEASESSQHKFVVTVRCDSAGSEFLEVLVSLPGEVEGTCKGLLGNCNGDAEDDETDEDTLAAAFAVTGESSIMYYATGETRRSFVDAAWRSTATALETTEAVNACAGLAGAMYQACVYDVSVTGDASFSAGRLAMQSAVGMTKKPLEELFLDAVVAPGGGGGEGGLSRAAKIAAGVGATGAGLLALTAVGAIVARRVAGSSSSGSNDVVLGSVVKSDMARRGSGAVPLRPVGPGAERKDSLVSRTSSVNSRHGRGSSQGRTSNTASSAYAQRREMAAGAHGRQSSRSSNEGAGRPPAFKN